VLAEGLATNQRSDLPLVASVTRRGFAVLRLPMKRCCSRCCEIAAFRHGLRATELVDLRWDQVDFNHGVLHVRRAKAGTPASHPLTGRELRALRRLQRETGRSTHLFMSERKAPISIDGYQKMIERTSIRAKLGFQVHAHMLRHACGYKLANGHRYQDDPGLPRPQGHSAYRAVHRALAGAVQGAMEGLS
jgi:integrase